MAMEQQHPGTLDAVAANMRLLRTDEWSLEEFIDETVAPPYAILSHTWLLPGQGEEVLFKDLEHIATASRRAGWYKLKFARSKARDDGLQYVWIDTCCIDKSSSAELSEAINSMYRWYQNARICYVYLEDLEEPELEQQITVETFCLKNNEATTQSSADGINTNRNFVERQPLRWFTRGWTLQELAAASKVDFYCKSWLKVGALPELAQPISEITGIDRDLLEGRRSLSSFSIAQRMYWASKRTTSRIEDRAYSLLGIFDVNLPVIYGEGERAFQRLQEELLRQYSDHSIFAWRRPDNEKISWRHMNLLASSPGDFAHLDSNSIVPVPRGPTQKEYDLTSRSITFDLPAFKTSRTRPHSLISHFIMLNCCYQDRSMSRVTLGLITLSSGEYMRVQLRECDVHDALLSAKQETFTVLRSADRKTGTQIHQEASSVKRKTIMLRHANAKEDAVKVHVMTVAKVSTEPEGDDGLGCVWDSPSRCIYVSYEDNEDGETPQKTRPSVCNTFKIGLLVLKDRKERSVYQHLVQGELSIWTIPAGNLFGVHTTTFHAQVKFDAQQTGFRHRVTAALNTFFTGIAVTKEGMILIATYRNRPLLGEQWSVVEFELMEGAQLPGILLQTSFSILVKRVRASLSKSFALTTVICSVLVQLVGAIFWITLTESASDQDIQSVSPVSRGLSDDNAGGPAADGQSPSGTIAHTASHESDN